MKKSGVLFVLFLSAAFAQAQTPAVADLSPEEQAAVAAILAKTTAEAEKELPPVSETVTVPAMPEVAAEKPAEVPNPEPPAAPVAAVPVAPTPEEPLAAEEPEEPDTAVSTSTACLPVAFIDIDVAFSKHPRTVAVKEQIRQKILTKEEEVKQARQQIEELATENARLSEQLRDLKPFYERIVVEPQPLLPKIEESADALEMANLLNRLTFSRSETLSASPLNTPARLEDITARMAENKKTIAQRSFFIDNYRYTTREEILKLEQQEVREILQDIYKEIKSFAKKRNIGVVVRKDEILYGAKPVNVTTDFVTRLKKSRKYRKRGK